LEDGGYIPVATTRPETILGDTGLAVHPDDERYMAYLGKMALVPILDRPIPVIADDYVDMSFGSGALKVTPGHDPNDFEIGQRHDLAVVSVMNKDATMSDAAGPYAGLDRFECRERLWADMEVAGLTIRKEAYTISVPRSQRGGEIIEPMVSKQWFVNAKPQADMALDAVRRGRIKIVPERFVKVWENWLENIQPWCVSRQLWWGHRIPVWYCDQCGHQTVARIDPDRCEKCGSEQIEQDPDVLDTWFSSALWPFSTLGWPEMTPDLERFYPTTVLETGYDILFFWVARMVMAAALYTNDIPFETIYLHGLVRDGQGRKMSKTIGNVVDPLEVMKEYGTDALRFTLLTGGTPGNDLNLSLAKVASNRNFANKIWNLTRFITQNLNKAAEAGIDFSKAEPQVSPADKWILTRLHEMTANADRLYESYQYGEAGRQIQEFLWGDFADWYVEVAKVQLSQEQGKVVISLAILRDVLDTCLRLLHPFIPFVTEETWQQMKRAFEGVGFGPANGWPEALIIANWPSSDTGLIETYSETAEKFELLREVVSRVRATRSEFNVEPGRMIAASVAAGALAAFFEEQRAILSSLARLDSERLQIQDEIEAPEDAVTISLGLASVYLPLAEMLDLDKERERLSLELDEVNQQITRLNSLLAGQFAEKAPPQVVEGEREKLARYKASKKEIEERLADLS
jgi:valyl-tRNA synthetase